MVLYNKTASSYEQLRTNLINEFKRRDANGDLSGESLSGNTAIQGQPIDDLSGAELINKALMIEDVNGLAFVEQGDVLPDISLLETAYNKWRSETMTGNSSCRGYCTGMCVGSCSGACTGCGSNCSKDCGVNCGGCKDTCSVTCGNSCTITCGDSCSGSCGGTCTGGCDGCQSGCTSTCSGCSGGAKN